MPQTVQTTRRERLELLIKEHGSLAALNAAMGMNRTDATFSQIRNQSVHSSTGKQRTMGDDLARRLEVRLGLPEGWMDTPLAQPGDERIERVVRLLQAMGEQQREQALNVVNALAGAATPAASGPAPAAAPGAPTPPAAGPDASPPPAAAFGPAGGSPPLSLGGPGDRPPLALVHS